jgi:hypothetical protein
MVRKSDSAAAKGASVGNTARRRTSFEVGDAFRDITSGDILVIKSFEVKALDLIGTARWAVLESSDNKVRISVPEVQLLGGTYQPL